MKLGIGLPNTLAFETDRRLFLDWARLADEAGFELLGAIDNPNFDSWDPLVSLAAAAPVTERIKLATTILQLPCRNEVLVAKHAAVVDQVSDGRLILGVAQGGRPEDFAVLDAPFEGRHKRFEKQIPRIREVWDKARQSTRDVGNPGPPPVQDPPPIWIGALMPPAIERALRLGDGFLFAAAGVEIMTQYTPGIREGLAANGKSDAPVGGIAYVAIDDNEDKAREEGSHHLVRYYGKNLWAPPEQILHYGSAEKVAEELQGYANAGIDVLVVFAETARLDQVEKLAEVVLPAYL